MAAKLSTHTYTHSDRRPEKDLLEALYPFGL
jgi:hypothetical protein